MPNMQEYCEFIDDSLTFRSIPVETSIKMILPYFDSSDLSDCSSKLLLCTAGEEAAILKDLPQNNTLNLIICNASEQTAYYVPDGENLNIVVSLWTVQRVCNILSKVFNGYLQFKKAFDTVLSNQGGIHDLLAETVKLTRGHITIHLLSSTFTLIDSCGPDAQSEKVSSNRTPVDILPGFLQEISSGKNSAGSIVTPVTGSSGILGYMMISCKDSDTIPDLFKNMLARRLSTLLGNSYTIYTREQKDLQKLLTDILLLTTDDVDKLYERLKHLPFPLKSHIRFLIISSLDKTASIWPMCSDLETILPRHNITVYDGYIVALFSGDSFLFRPETEEKQLEAFLKDHNAYAIFTSPAKLIRGFKTLYMQARELLPKIPLLMDVSKKRLVYFEDIFGFYRVHLCSIALKQHLGHDKIIYLAHPVAIEIIRYDITHKTDYFEFIVEYSKCAGNIQETAAQTHMHRSSAYNKLNKIIELFGIDFSDGQLQRNLIFSMNIIKYNGMKPEDLIYFTDPASSRSKQ